MPGAAPYIASTVPQKMEGMYYVAGPATSKMWCVVTASCDLSLHMLLTKTPYGCIGRVISFATLPSISKGTNTRMWMITIYCDPGSPQPVCVGHSQLLFAVYVCNLRKKMLAAQGYRKQQDQEWSAMHYTLVRVPK